MKNAYLIVGAVLAAGTANAGGFNPPTVEASPVVVSTPAPYSWAGAYVGGNLNYGEAKAKAAGEFGSELSSEGISKTLAKPDGMSAALRAGYDWQFGNVIAGLGGEYNLGQYKSGLSGMWGDELPDVDVKVKNVATLFARLGYAFDDHWMGYGLLGYSWGKGKISGYGESESVDLDGMSYGLGVSYAIDQKWSAYGEYTFTDFGKVDKTDGNLKAELQQIKLGVNYRF